MGFISKKIQVQFNIEKIIQEIILNKDKMTHLKTILDKHKDGEEIEKEMKEFMESDPGHEIIKKNIKRASKFIHKSDIKEAMRKKTVNSSLYTPSSRHLMIEESSISSLEVPDEKGSFVFKDNILKPPDRIKV